jgi:DNA-binding MarR family transcriptional regulator
LKWGLPLPEQDPIERDFGRIISFLYRKSLVHVKAALKKFNLSAGEQPFFMLLRCYDGTTAEELCSMLDIDKAAAARAVKSLEGKGFVKRVRGVEDKRQNKLFLTTKARRQFVGIDAALSEWNAVMTGGIDENTLETVFNALSKMQENINNIGNSENPADFSSCYGDAE